MGDLLIEGAAAREHGLRNRDGGGLDAFVGKNGLQVRLHVGLVGSELRGSHNHTVALDMYRIGHHKVHVTTDAGTGIPAARRRLMVDLDGNGVELSKP